jgi:hypothetical protein
LLRGQVSSLYINIRRVAGVRHRVFSSRLSIVSLPRRCDVERSSVVLTRVRASINSSLVITSSTMFSYPPYPWIPARDNLVSRSSGSASAAMSVQSGVGTRAEQQIAICGGAAMAVSRDGRPRVASRRCTCILTGSGRHIKLWGRFSKCATDTNTAAPPYVGRCNRPDQP